MIDEVVVAAEVTSSGTLYTGKGRLRGVYVRAAGTAGTAVFKKGGSSGTTILTIDTPAAIGGHFQAIPGAGIPFTTDLYVALTTADACTVYIGEDRSVTF